MRNELNGAGWPPGHARTGGRRQLSLGQFARSLVAAALGPQPSSPQPSSPSFFRRFTTLAVLSGERALHSFR